MSASAVQFRGADNVVSAYESNAVAKWALFIGKDIFSSYNGDDLAAGAAKLEGILHLMSEAFTGAAYQLRMYEDPIKTISNVTPFNYSFKFKVMDDDDQESGTMYSKLTAKMAMLEKKIAEQDEDEDPDAEVGGFQGALLGMVNRPDVQNMLLNSVIGLVNQWMGKMQPAAAAMGSVPAEPPAAPAAPAGDDQEETASFAKAYGDMVPEQKALFDAAIKILVTKDPYIGTNLIGLANILQNDPSKYTWLAKML
jgi:hypothetical protein